MALATESATTRSRTDEGVSSAPHPLDPLSCEEIATAADVVKRGLAEAGEARGHLRFETIELEEPPKSLVRDFRSGGTWSRRARVNVYRTGAIGVWRAVVSLSERKLASCEHVPDARPMIQLSTLR